jgi:hypothetical protein
LSGAVMDPRAITELLPDWKAQGAPLEQPVTGDDVLFLSETGTLRTPDWLVPRNLHNDGCYVVSLGNVVRWLAQQAEALGVEIFPGFAAAEVLYDDQGAVRGVATGNMGVGKDGEPGDGFQLGMELSASTPSSPRARVATWASSSSRATSSTRARTRRASPSASRNCGRSTRRAPSPAWWCTPRAGRCATRPSAAASCITWPTTR